MTASALKHPAKFSDAIIPVILSHLTALQPLDGSTRRLLDPFAGTGKIHKLWPAYNTFGLEIEPEWASLHERTIVGSVLQMPFADAYFDAVATSPPYGNRMADHHNAKDGSERNTYKHKLGRDLHPESGAQLHWGPKYWAFMEKAYAEIFRVLKSGGVFVLNVSDFIKKKEVVEAVAWHVDAVQRAGFAFFAGTNVPTPRNRNGANADLRVDHEFVMSLIKPKVKP